MFAHGNDLHMTTGAGGEKKRSIKQQHVPFLDGVLSYFKKNFRSQE